MSNPFKKVCVLYNPIHQNSMLLIHEIAKILKKYDIETLFQDVKPTTCVCIENFDFESDLNIVIGGDGTLLCAARCFAPKGIPLLGINSGHLGFLSQLSTEYLELNIDKLLKGDFRIEERLMLQAVTSINNPTRIFSALNEVVIKRGALSNPVVLSVYIGEDKVNDFLGDGLIVSTPTGSTAYNLSVGGPIVSPEMNAIILSPIASHSLAIRPIVIPDDKVVKITITNEPEYVYLNADGQEYTALSKGATVYITKYAHKAKLVLLNKNKDCFFNILRSKLHWGIFPGICPPTSTYDDSYSE